MCARALSRPGTFSPEYYGRALALFGRVAAATAAAPKASQPVDIEAWLGAMRRIALRDQVAAGDLAAALALLGACPRQFATIFADAYWAVTSDNGPLVALDRTLVAILADGPARAFADGYIEAVPPPTASAEDFQGWMWILYRIMLIMSVPRRAVSLVCAVQVVRRAAETVGVRFFDVYELFAGRLSGGGRAELVAAIVAALKAAAPFSGAALDAYELAQATGTEMSPRRRAIYKVLKAEHTRRLVTSD